MLPTAKTPRPLPNPQHASRVPADITLAQVDRLRQSAYLLPQVVQPADHYPDDVPEADAATRLDALGLILLQKAAAGNRPSRWIAPALIAEALRHLDAVGTGQSVKALMHK